MTHARTRIAAVLLAMLLAVAGTVALCMVVSTSVKKEAPL